MKTLAALLLLFCLSLHAQQPASPPASTPAPAKPAAPPSLSGQWEIFIGASGTGILLNITQNGEAISAAYQQIPENNRYGIRPGFDFFTATTGGGGSMTIRKGDVTQGKPVEKEQAPFQFTLSADGQSMTCVVQSADIRKEEREFQLVRKAQIKNLRLLVQGTGGLQPASQIIEGEPMIVAVEMNTATQSPVEITLVSGKTTLKLTAKPQEASSAPATAAAPAGAAPATPATPATTASATPPSTGGQLFTEIFLPTFSDQLGAEPAPPSKTDDAPPEGRDPAKEDWKNLIGMWKTLYRDEVLGTITGWVDIDQYGRMKLSYQQPGTLAWQDLKLTSTRVVGDIPTLPATPAADGKPAQPEQPALPKLKLVFEGRGVTSTPIKPVPPGKAVQFLLDTDAPQPIKISADKISAEVGLTRKDTPDAAKVTLELDSRDSNGVLMWNWSYKADRGTARDRDGLGRVGTLLRLEGKDESSLGKMAGREAWLRQPPQVVHAYALENQLAVDPDTTWQGEAQPKYRVADKKRTIKSSDGSSFDDTLTKSGNAWRTVFIIARNLPPDNAGKTTLEIVDGSGVTEYRIKSRGGEKTATDIDLIKAWQDYRSAVPPGAGNAVPDGETEEGIIAQAFFKADTPPKPQKFLLDGAPGEWLLLYGDTIGQFNIVRDLSKSHGAEGDMPAEKGQQENVSIAFVPEQLRLSVRVQQEVPTIDHIDAVLALQDAGAEARDMQKVVLTPDPNDPKVYLSQPIELVREDDYDKLKSTPGAVTVIGRKGGLIRGQVAQDSGYAITPSSVQAQIDTTPANINALWKDAVKRAADLAGQPIEDWNLVANGKAGAETNFIITDYVFGQMMQPSATFLNNINSLSTFVTGSGIDGIPLVQWWRQYPDKNSPIRSLSISIGDHAAMLLLRNEFVIMMQEKATDWQRNGGNAAMWSFYNTQKGAIAAQQSPMSFIRVPVKSLPGYNPKKDSVAEKISLFFREDEQPFLHLLFDDTSLSGKLHVDKSDSDFAALQWEAFKYAYTQWGTLINQSIAKAQNIPDGDVSGLMKLTGIGFEPVVQRLLPKLMKLQDDDDKTRTRWVPDYVARAFVNGLGVLGAAIQAQKEFSEADTKVVQMTAALASIALGNVGGVWAAVGLPGRAVAEIAGRAAALALVSGDAAYNIVDSGLMNSSRREDAKFEIGAGAVLGADRAAAASSKILSTTEQAVAIGGSLLGVAGEGSALKTAIKSAGALTAAEVAEQASQILQKVDVADPAALRLLSKGDQAVLARYVQDAEKMALSGRVGELTEDASKVLTNRSGIFAALQEGSEANQKLTTAVREVTEAPALNLSRADLDEAGRNLDSLIKNTEEEVNALKAAKPADGSAEAARLDELKGQLGDLKQRRTVVTTFQEPVVKLPPDIAAGLGGEAGTLTEAERATVDGTRNFIKNGNRYVGDGLKDVNLAATERRLGDLAEQTKTSISELEAAGTKAAPGELDAAKARLQSLESTRDAVKDMNESVRDATRTKLSLDDVELLQGKRMQLTDLDRAQVEKTILDAGGDWKKIVQKAKGSGEDQLLMHKVSAYRREIVNNLADEVIADVQKTTGQKLYRDAFGSSNLSSDYDVAFRGPGAELGVAEFNSRIRNYLGGIESGGALDTNFYTDPVYKIFKGEELAGAEGGLSRAEFDTSRQFLYQQMANAKYRSPEQLAQFREGLLSGVPENLRGPMGDLLDQAKGANDLAQGRIAQRLADRASQLGKDVSELTDADRLRVTNDLYADSLGQIHQYRQFVDHLDAVKAGEGLLSGAPIPALLKDTQLAKKLASIDELLANPATRDAGLTALADLRGRAILNMRNEQGLALSFASEAYQTGDTIGHVVGELQAGGIKVSPEDIFNGVRRESKISADGYVNSYYENGANLIKELNGKHVIDHDTGALLKDLQPSYLDAAATKSAKYFVRQIDAAHMAGTDLLNSGIPDIKKLVQATVDLDAARDSPAKFSDVLRKLGWTPDQYVNQVLNANKVLDSKVVAQSSLMDFAQNLGSTALPVSAPASNLTAATNAARVAGMSATDIDRMTQNAPASPAALDAWRTSTAQALRNQTQNLLNSSALPADAPVLLPAATRNTLQLPDSSTSDEATLQRQLRASNRYVTPLISATSTDALQAQLQSNRTVLTQIDLPAQKSRAWVRVQSINGDTIRADDPTTGQPIDYPASVFRALTHNQSHTLIIDPYRNASGQYRPPATFVGTLLPLDQVMPLIR